jgi:hypothetical protein
MPIRRIGFGFKVEQLWNFLNFEMSFSIAGEFPSANPKPDIILTPLAARLQGRDRWSYTQKAGLKPNPALACLTTSDCLFNLSGSRSTKSPKYTE